MNAAAPVPPAPGAQEPAAGVGHHAAEPPAANAAAAAAAAAAPAAGGGRGSRPPGSAPVTPSASCISEDSDLTHSQEWWLPQPKPSLDEKHIEWRPAVPLLECLQCKVCNDLLKEAITAAECGHSYCYDCIDECITIGGRANFCPICNVLLGPNPFEHNKLKYDFLLDSLVRKIFPRPLLDAALETRRLEREEATRQAKANINRRPGRVGRINSSSQLTAAGASRAAGQSAAAPGDAQVELALFPLDPSGSSSHNHSSSIVRPSEPLNAVLPVLPKPYIRAPAAMTVGALKSWLSDRLAGKKADSVRLPSLQLLCAGRILDTGMTLQQLYNDIWKPHFASSKAAGAGSGAIAGQVPAAAGAAAVAAQGAAAGEAGRDAGSSHDSERIMLIQYRP